MILESIFSCSYLLLICGSSLYTLREESYERHKRLPAHFAWAFLGFGALGARSLFVLAYKLFFKSYDFDPTAIEIEEKRNKLRTNLLDELLRSLGVASLIYSLCSHHERSLLGACVISGISLLDLLRLRESRRMQRQDSDGTGADVTMSIETGHITFCWVLFNVYFSYTVGNNYGLVASYPYFITTCALPTEGFYQGWTMRRTINDYMIAAYVILMTEALRQET